MDRVYKWYSSTIVEKEHRVDDGTIMPMVKVGFRVYDGDGDKSNEMGNYFGQSENLDNMIGAWTVRIQPPGTMVQQRDMSGNLIPLIENNVVVSKGSKQTSPFESAKQ